MLRTTILGQNSMPPQPLPRDFSSLSKGQLEMEMRLRGLSTVGAKRELIFRLQKSTFEDATVRKSSTDGSAIIASSLPKPLDSIKADVDPSSSSPTLSTFSPSPPTTQKTPRRKRTPQGKPRGKGETMLSGMKNSGSQQSSIVHLLTLSKMELQAMAVQLGVAKSGTKGQIAERIIAAQQDQPATVSSAAATNPSTNTKDAASSIATPTSDSPNLTPSSSSRRKKKGAEAINGEGSANVRRRQRERRTDTASREEQHVLKTREDGCAALTSTAASSSTFETDDISTEVGNNHDATTEAPRPLTPGEAASILEDLVRQKGTGGLGRPERHVGPDASEMPVFSAQSSSTSLGASYSTLSAFVGGSRHVEVPIDEVTALRAKLQDAKERLSAQERLVVELRAVLSQQDDHLHAAVATSGPTNDALEESASIGSSASSSETSLAWLGDNEKMNITKVFRPATELLPTATLKIQNTATEQDGIIDSEETEIIFVNSKAAAAADINVNGQGVVGVAVAAGLLAAAEATATAAGIAARWMKDAWRRK